MQRTYLSLFFGLLLTFILISGAESSNGQDAELISNVKSNISLTMTPDLPGNLAEEDYHNPIVKTLDNGVEISPDSISNKTVIDAESVSEDNADSTIEWKNHTSLKHGFGMQYPDGATITEGRDSPYDPDKDLSINNLADGYIFSVGQPDTFYDSNEFATGLMKYMTDLYDYDIYYIPIQDVIPVTINNKIYYTFTISQIDKETDKSVVVQQVFVTSDNDDIYQFTFSARTENMDSTKDIRDHMMESIRYFD